MTLTLQDFIASWKSSTRSERSGSQEHYLDLCQALGVPTPSQTDPTGEFYTFERRVTKTGGGGGFADVWRRGYFAWEYKGKHKNLVEAYKQLLLYRENLDNPPLLVVCDFYRFEVHTNFTNTAPRVYEFTLDDLGKSEPLPGTNLNALAVLRAVLTEPERLRPQQTVEEVTEKIASQFAELARNLQARGEDPERSAHFLMRLLFCLFAEDISNLLPGHLFTQLLENTRRDPASFNAQLRQLFAVMATGGFFGFAKIPYFNGGLFNDMATIDLTGEDMDVLLRASRLDWAAIEPAIFGTLFERSLDPAKRSQLGAHYTSKEDILLIVEPVLMEPLRRRWLQVQEEADKVIALRDSSKDPGQRTRRHNELARLLADFTDELHAVRVLDPACGSGNFLYVALKRLLDLEKEVSAFGTANGLTAMMPNVDPSQLYGIELNPYAHELASVVVWIGYIQWLHSNGFGTPAPPILRRLDNIRQMDAILAYDAEGKPVEPEWPQADIIIGNPPFLGGSKIRGELGDKYTEDLWKLYTGRIANGADLVVYWFERARSAIASNKAGRAGLLATQSIRAGANRLVLERIKQSGDIFLAWSDRPWILEGAAVRVSIVCFDDGTAAAAVLNGELALSINPDLTSTHDITKAQRLKENEGIAFQGPSPKGPFDIPAEVAQTFLKQPPNINGRPNSDVVRQVVSAADLAQGTRDKWTVDFGLMPITQASEYEAPFEYVKKYVYPIRTKNRRVSYAQKWWQYAEARPGMRKALIGMSRCIATPRVAKHRFFVWLPISVLANDRTFVFARQDDYFFGVLHSRLHEVWSLATSSRHGVGNDPTYNNTTCFETYPFPWPSGKEPNDDHRVTAIAEAARELVEKRDRWLNLEFPAADLKKLTLTNLYNARPTWLDLAHKKLDLAVLDASAGPTASAMMRYWRGCWRSTWSVRSCRGNIAPEGKRFSQYATRIFKNISPVTHRNTRVWTHRLAGRDDRRPELHGQAGRLETAIS